MWCLLNSPTVVLSHWKVDVLSNLVPCIDSNCVQKKRECYRICSANDVHSGLSLWVSLRRVDSFAVWKHAEHYSCALLYPEQLYAVAPSHKSIMAVFQCHFTDIQLAFSKYQLVPVYDSQLNTSKTALCSGGFRNVERGVWLLAGKAQAKLLCCHAHFRHAGSSNCRTEYLEATLGLVKRLEITKELIREHVTVPGCCCCIIIWWTCAVRYA